MHLVHTSFHVAIESQDFWFAQLSLHDSEVPNLYNGDYKTQFKECYQFGDSKILKTYQQRKLLGDWYGEREKWKCAFRASEHEYRAAAFHRICDPLGPTLSIIRCTNGYVFGGYTSLSWAAVSWSQDPKAFCKYQVAARHDPFSLTPAIVFSIVNPTNKPAKLVLGNANDTYAMGGNSAYGPIFGAGNDLVISDTCNTTQNITQVNCTFKLPDHLKHINGEEYLTGYRTFLVDEMEVFVSKSD